MHRHCWTCSIKLKIISVFGNDKISNVLLEQNCFNFRFGACNSTDSLESFITDECYEDLLTTIRAARV